MAVFTLRRDFETPLRPRDTLLKACRVLSTAVIVTETSGLFAIVLCLDFEVSEPLIQFAHRDFFNLSYRFVQPIRQSDYVHSPGIA